MMHLQPPHFKDDPETGEPGLWVPLTPVYDFLYRFAIALLAALVIHFLLGG